ncbi:MAG: hypothetical protein FWF57_06120 [Defluviitaleaceae bacterium]|nr:hypothetical protein [Defluviitaleaceae bacterium]
MNKFLKKSLIVLVVITTIFPLTKTYALDNNQLKIVNEFDEFLFIKAGNQMLVSNEEVWGNNGFWERSFQTVSPAFGTGMNVWYRNDTPRPVIVRVERRLCNMWSTVTELIAPANSQKTRQIMLSMYEFNHEMRVTVSNASGVPVDGEVAIRQTTQPLS